MVFLSKICQPGHSAQHKQLLPAQGRVSYNNQLFSQDIERKTFECPALKILVWTQLYKEGVLGLQCVN